MVRRAIKELSAEGWLLFGGMLACFGCVYALTIFGTSAGLCEGCIMDAFAFTSRLLPGTVCLIAMLVIVAAGRAQERPERVVRQKKLSSVWIYTMVKTALAAAFFSICIFVATLAVGRILSDQMFTWNQIDSYFAFFLGKTTTEINYGMIFLAYISECFFGIFLAAALARLIQWYTMSGLSGVFLTVIIYMGMDIRGWFWDERRDVFYKNIYDGIDVRYQFIFPAAAAVLICVAGLMKDRRDFLAKEKQEET